MSVLVCAKASIWQLINVRFIPVQLLTPAGINMAIAGINKASAGINKASAGGNST